MAECVSVAAGGNSYEYACWEWQRDDGGFSPFTPVVSYFIETAFMAGKKEYAKPEYAVDFDAMTLTHIGGAVVRSVQRVGVDIAGVQDMSHYWMWEYSPGEFVPYDMEGSVDLELAYQDGEVSVDLSTCYCRLQYTVDFTTSQQTSHVYKTKRAVQRVTLPKGTTLKTLLKIPHSLSSATRLSSSAQSATVSASGTQNPQIASKTSQTSVSGKSSSNSTYATTSKSHPQGISSKTTSSHLQGISSTKTSSSKSQVSKVASSSTTAVHSQGASNYQASVAKPLSHSSHTSSHRKKLVVSQASHHPLHTKKVSAGSTGQATSAQGTSRTASVQAGKPLAFNNTTSSTSATSGLTAQTAKVQVAKSSATSKPTTQASSGHAGKSSSTSTALSSSVQASKPLALATNVHVTAPLQNAGTLQPQAAQSNEIDADILASYDLVDDVLSSYSKTSEVPAERAVVVRSASLKSRVGDFFGKALRGAISVMREPIGWKLHLNGEDYLMVPLLKTSSEYQRVEAKFTESLANKFTITSITRVQNRWLWARYSQAKSQLQSKNAGAANEKELFHGSKNTPSEEICASEEGFDMRFSRQGLWGTANYFAVQAYYSHHYAYCMNDKFKTKELILAKVLTGCSFECEPDQTLRLPPLKQQGTRSLKLKQVRYDSVCGLTQGYKVYMTYANDRAYPAYVIHYV